MIFLIVEVCLVKLCLMRGLESEELFSLFALVAHLPDSKCFELIKGTLQGKPIRHVYSLPDRFSFEYLQHRLPEFNPWVVVKLIEGFKYC